MKTSIGLKFKKYLLYFHCSCISVWWSLIRLSVTGINACSVSKSPILFCEQLWKCDMFHNRMTVKLASSQQRKFGKAHFIFVIIPSPPIFLNRTWLNALHDYISSVTLSLLVTLFSGFPLYFPCSISHCLSEGTYSRAPCISKAPLFLWKFIVLYHLPQNHCSVLTRVIHKILVAFLTWNVWSVHSFLSALFQCVRFTLRSSH